MQSKSTWHWQEKLEPVAVEGACRWQILKIRKSKSFSLWLNEKNRRSREETPNHDDDSQHKQAEIDAAFRDWLRRKRSSKRHKNAPNVEGNLQHKSWSKPPSLHVNPKAKKGSTRKAGSASMTEAQQLARKHSEAKNKQAYNAWLARVHLEDRVRRTQRRDELDRLEQQQRDKHKKTWRKKVAVCAYSTLVIHG